ncbi:hypothetical protein F0562_001344 [Nyssa sinensis]|uniref:Uncharacterized protein n=1 Tax=Nyssa sinensis TaxID=561372 RepID=A0A5J5C2W0_9ASTE|nr:hypothetical protein F0562_001344 [Nyssa sinensis]
MNWKVQSDHQKIIHGSKNRAIHMHETPFFDQLTGDGSSGSHRRPNRFVFPTAIVVDHGEILGSEVNEDERVNRRGNEDKNGGI